MKTLSSNLWVKGKPLLPSSSDCAKLIRIKIPGDEVHWRGTSHSTGTLSNPHPVASEQLPTAEISHARDIPLPPEPILAPHTFDFFRIQTYRFHPARLRSLWSGFLKHFLICILVWTVWGAFHFQFRPACHTSLWRYPQAAASKTYQNQIEVGQDMPKVRVKSLVQLHDYKRAQVCLNNI